MCGVCVSAPVCVCVWGSLKLSYTVVVGGVFVRCGGGVCVVDFVLFVCSEYEICVAVVKYSV